MVLAHDQEALRFVEQLAREPELHQRYSDYYAYEFFVVRRLANSSVGCAC
jgi:hypothetical protein